MSDEREIFWKEAMLTYLKTKPEMLLEKFKNSMKLSVRIASNLGEI
jgi:hypothetical protein